MANPKINVTMPDGLMEYIDDIVSRGRYHNAAEFLRALVRDHQERSLVFGFDVDQYVQEGLDSGISKQSPKAFHAEMRATLKAGVKKRANAGK